MKKYTFTILVILFSNILQAQNNQEIISNAMRDELNRTMDSLANLSCNSPCFVSYHVREGKMMLISASLGALSQSKIIPTLSNSTRMLVGDYNINDENFNYKRNEGFIFQQNIKIPYKPDYWGLRRTLWSASERTYKSACKKYRAKLAALEDNEIKTEEYVLPDFAEAPVVNLNVSGEEINLDQLYWEKVAKEVSEVFIDYPEIISSNVNITLSDHTSHFLSSEGSSFVYPLTYAGINISASISDKNNANRREAIFFSGINEKNLPSTDSLIKACNTLINDLKEYINLEKLKDEYSGPVLFEQEAAANIFLTGFFARDGLIARREAINYNAYEFRYPTEPIDNSIESKIGDQIVSGVLTLKALSRLKKYKGMDLWGAFEVDAEGVVPPEELTLIENGILKTMLNGRTPTFGVKRSNGHNRLNTFRGKNIYPGIVQVIASETISKEGMKKKLLENAKENGEDFAFIIRRKPHSNQNLVYKVNIETGKETQVRIGRTHFPKIKDFWRVLAFSNKEMVTNHGNSSYFGGMFTSIICPDAVLMKNIKLAPVPMERKLKGPVIKSPLVSN